MGPSKATMIGVVAIASAIAIWSLAVVTLLGGSAPGITSSDVLVVVALIVLACLVDGLVAVRAVRGRVGLLGLGWLGLRVLISGAGFLLLTLPSYVVAALALSRRPAPAANVDPTRPHAFRPVSSGWFGSSLAPMNLSRNLIGAQQFAAGDCVVCGAAEGSSIHAPVPDVATG